MQANPIIIWPGATIDWAGRMAPFSQDTNLSLSGVGNRRRISGLTDSRAGGHLSLVEAIPFHWRFRGKA